MSASTPAVTAAVTYNRERVHDRTASVPWYVWVSALAVTSATVGLQWDVSWHRSIGRDTFWTPAHVAVYACGVLAAVVGLWLVIRATFNQDPELRAASVNIFGLRAPLGVFVAGWGGLAMLTAGPFDNWWHNAYGLDVQIVSPTHFLLILGLRAVAVGTLFLILAAMNRAADAGDANYAGLRAGFLYVGGLIVGGQMWFLQESTPESQLHRTGAYTLMALAVPVVLALLSQASRYRWAATSAASVYTLFILGEILILPLFPAQPKLGPVLYPVTHFVPAKFPVLIVAPALALDLFWHRVRSWPLWQIALVSGALFVAVLMAVEWPFASFLMSKFANNRFFGSIYFDYRSPPMSSDRLRRFYDPVHGVHLAAGMLRAAVAGAVSTWLGLAFGRWMRGVQR